MRTLLALALLAPVAAAQDDDPVPVPVAPAPRLKTLPTVKKKSTPPVVAPPLVEPKPMAKVEPTPAPKTAPTPEPMLKTLTRVDPPRPPAPKAEPPVEPKADPKTDAKADVKVDAKADYKGDTKPDTKDEKPAPTATPVVKFPEPAFNDYQLPLIALAVVGVVAVLVVVRSYVFPPKA